MTKVWFVTGASRGFGRCIVNDALERGDKVVATARDLSTLDELSNRYGDALFPLELDVNDREADGSAVRSAHEHFGRLDVVVNNAGYGHFGYLEEVTEEEARAQIETNLFGPLWITQAALPILRAQGSGHIVQISSIGGVAAFPGIGIYHASKWGLEGFSEALAAEVAEFGIKVTLVEPGGYATDWGGSSASFSAPNPVYQPFRDAMQSASAAAELGQPGGVADAVLAVVDAVDPPLRILCGNLAFDLANSTYGDRLRMWSEWEATSRAAETDRS
jgi:NAD(P)-dependent dehydrogenase (short-subunit alcohol dehydrogenase family)